MPTFDWAYKNFPTVAAFEAYLQTLTPPTWAVGITLHHTWKPTVADWRGQRSMEALARYYRAEVKNADGSKGWPAGPNLFIGSDGISQGTPVNHKGVHAGPCNATRISIEVVGDYDKTDWQEPIKSFTYGAIVALLRWLGKDHRAINGHRDCMPGQKTCPGNAVDLDRVRDWTKFLLATPVVHTPIGTLSVDPLFAAYWQRSGGVWQRDRTALGWPTSPGFRGADGFLYQLFERGGLRYRSDETPAFIEALLTHEVEALKRERA